MIRHAQLLGTIGLLSVPLLAGCGGTPAAEPAADPLADAAQNIRLVGHSDLQGRESLLVAVRADDANGNWAYVGHHENFYDETQKLNPITGRMEWNGTSILDVNDPATPTLVWHIPNENNASSRSVSVVYDYTFDSAAGEPGFRSTIAQIWDLRDPKQPKFVGRMWIPGQKDGEPGNEGQYAHHPNVDEQNKRVYIGYRESGWTAAFDISNPAQPTLVWSLDLNPPHRGPHTVAPIVYDKVPNFGPDALPRTYAFVVDEAGAPEDLAPCRGIRSKSYVFDITNEARPIPVSTWQVPADAFCNKGGRFGPHQQAETVNGRLNRFEDKLAWVAYFNAGVRLVDLSDPYNPREVGYYVPKPNERSHPVEKGQGIAIQMNDVDLDDRGLAYATDRTGAGLFILQRTGTAARSGT